MLPFVFRNVSMHDDMSFFASLELPMWGNELSSASQELPK